MNRQGDLKMNMKSLILLIGITCTLIVGYFGISGSGKINDQLDKLHEIKNIHTVQAEEIFIEILKYSKKQLIDLMKII